MITSETVAKMSEQIKRNEREHDRIWNAAIEAAAKWIEHQNCNYEQYEIEAEEIRKLKK